MKSMSYEECSRYFVRKFTEWSNASPDQDLRIYINNKKRKGLVEEFRNDPNYHNTVCAYLAEYAKDNERNIIADIIGDTLFDKEAMSAELAVVVDAVLEACGYEEDPNAKWRNALVAGIVVLLVGGLIAALAGGRRR